MRQILALVILSGLMLPLDCLRPPGKRPPGNKGFRERLHELLNKHTSRDGPVRIEVLSSDYGKNLRIKCVANVTHAVSFEWRFHNQTLSDNERVKIESTAQQSELTIWKAMKPDRGSYQCTARFNRSLSVVSVFVEVKPSLKIKLRPKDILLRSGETFQWHCDNTEGNLTNATYSWARKLLPRGPWERIAVNNERYEWTLPRRLQTEKDNYDVYDMHCEITYNGITVRGPIARVVVILPGTASKIGSCPAEVSEGIQWKETLIGMVDAQSCVTNDDNSGIAKRACDVFPGRPPRWRPPNLNDCSSPEFTSLHEKFDALEKGFKVNLDIPKALEQLRTLTRVHPRPGTARSARLFGKDLLSTVDILKRTRGFLETQPASNTSAIQTLSFFTETVSNVLDLENQETWLEVEEDNPEAPAVLVTSLDKFGFDLEKGFAGTSSVIQNRVEKNLAFQVRRIDVKSLLRKRDVIFAQNKSRIVLPRTILNETSSEPVIVVSVVYDTLAAILNVNATGTNLSSNLTLLPNSTVISSTVRPISEGKFKQPVRIVLETNGMIHNESLHRRCVFWQPEENNRWSDEGCRLVPDETTKEVTTCECDHLTLFAVMVESGGGNIDSEELARLEIISTVGSAISLAAILLTMIIYIYYWKTLWSPRFVNFMNLCLSIALLDIFSMLRGPFKEDEVPCTAIGIILHFFVLALFMWMLCEGILLVLLLMNVFKKDYGRKWYIFVYLIGWGLPALVVVVSVSIRGSSSYGLSGHCWLTRSNGFIWAAIAPMIVVLLASYVVYGIMLHRVITSHKVQQENTLGKIKATARASIIIMPVLGFAWTWAILDFFFDQLAFKYLFAIFNSLQGLFIFIFHCVMNKQIYQAMFKTKKPERKSILDRVKTQEMRMTASQDSLESIK